MVLADPLKQFLLHLESYLVYEKEHDLDIAINNVCSWLFFLCQYIEASLKIM